MKEMKKLLILAGLSAVGKTTLAKYITEKDPNFVLVRSATTRAPRGDGHDAEYVYLSEAEFSAALESGGMLEHTEYAGNFYGTPRSEIEDVLGAGKTPLLILDVEGVKSIKRAGEYPSLAVYLYDDPNVLEERLYVRYIGDAPTVDGLARFSKRKEQNIADILSLDEFSGSFDLFVRNSELSSSSDAVLTALGSDGVPDNGAAKEELAAIREYVKAKQKR
ncbi:MAG: hypothetical protein IKB38_09305 [Clostridia bacterium]|nr:hypothetical protein [Clostridia bacterium]